MHRLRILFLRFYPPPDSFLSILLFRLGPLANNFAITPLQSHPSEIRRSEHGLHVASDAGISPHQTQRRRGTVASCRKVRAQWPPPAPDSSPSSAKTRRAGTFQLPASLAHPSIARQKSIHFQALSLPSARRADPGHRLPRPAERKAALSERSGSRGAPTCPDRSWPVRWRLRGPKKLAPLVAAQDEYNLLSREIEPPAPRAATLPRRLSPR
jgi:hypothetical protein